MMYETNQKLTGEAQREHAKLPLVLLAIQVVVCVVTALTAKAGTFSWFLEVGPGIIGIAVMIAVYRRFPMSHFVYIGVFIHMFILIYGGFYTYAETPLGNWARDAFGLSRNHYDRVGHVALGVFPAFIIREVLLRRTLLERGGWFFFITTSIVLAIAAIWEFIEWGSVYVLASEQGAAFLGSQGDIWDAHWDMLLAWVGSMVVLPLFGGLHDRSMSKVSDR
jgi:putative membrane protein